jgi:hypothetical protein
MAAQSLRELFETADGIRSITGGQDWIDGGFAEAVSRSHLRLWDGSLDPALPCVVAVCVGASWDGYQQTMLL